ncbi:hypothetical protein H4R33_001700 [Dimargaris cristalligena]|nr:hypothetical protein H4R33_001700 [Dimargaris cristalligena]
MYWARVGLVSTLALALTSYVVAVPLLKLADNVACLNVVAGNSGGPKKGCVSFNKETVKRPPKPCGDYRGTGPNYGGGECGHYESKSGDYKGERESNYEGRNGDDQGRGYDFGPADHGHGDSHNDNGPANHGSHGDGYSGSGADHGRGY